MQGIYTYIPETNHVPKEYNVTAILSLLFTVPISPVPVLTLMYFYILLLLFNCNWVDTRWQQYSTQNTEDGTHITITREKSNDYKEKIGK
jgi:hypothetical protein